MSLIGMVDLCCDGCNATNFGRLREWRTANPIEGGRIFGLWKFGQETMSKDVNNALFESDLLDAGKRRRVSSSVSAIRHAAGSG